MTVLRSLLFVPGNQPNMLEKATGFQPDAFVPDMEDSVPMEERPTPGRPWRRTYPGWRHEARW